jgi:hypothetical protein
MITSTDRLHPRRVKKNMPSIMPPDNRVAGFPPAAEAGAAAILLVFRKTGQRLASILTRGALAWPDEAQKRNNFNEAVWPSLIAPSRAG